MMTHAHRLDRQRNRIRHFFRGLLSLAVVLAPARAGSAPAAQPIIVLKGHIGLPESKEMEGIAPIIDAQFEAVGFASRPDTVERILGGRLPHPGVRDRGLSAADLIRPIDLGFDDWFHGLFAEAVKKLLPAKERMFRNSGLLVTDTKNLDSTFKGLVALSLSQRKIGQPEEAAATMTDLVRIFRSRPVSRTDWGLPAEEYWRSIARPVLAAPMGQLYVTTGNDHAVIYVDNQIRGVGKAEVADAVPGVHHILIQVPTTAGLQYDVPVKANQNTALDVKWDVETALTVTDIYIGFVYTSEADRNRESLLAGDLAKRWGQEMLVVVDFIRYQDEQMLFGALYRANGKVVRGAIASLDHDVLVQVHDLAQFLWDGTKSARLKVLQGDPTVEASRLSPHAMASPEPRSTLLAKAVGGLGALAFVGGSLVYVTSKADDYTQPTYDDKRSPAVQVAVGGSVALGAGVCMWLRESRSAELLPSLLLGAGTASILSGGVLFLTDEDPHTDGYQRQYFRNTARTGVLVGAAGLAATGAGLWLWRREQTTAATSEAALRRSNLRHTWSAPVVTLSSSHVLLSWIGNL